MNKIDSNQCSLIHLLFFGSDCVTAMCFVYVEIMNPFNTALRIVLYMNRKKKNIINVIFKDMTA